MNKKKYLGFTTPNQKRVRWALNLIRDGRFGYLFNQAAFSDNQSTSYYHSCPYFGYNLRGANVYDVKTGLLDYTSTSGYDTQNSKRKRARGFVLKRSYSSANLKTFWEEFLRDVEGLVKDDSHKCKNLFINLLNEKKSKILKMDLEDSKGRLDILQREIEDLTTKFDEANIHKETSQILRLMIGPNLISAKSYLHQKLPEELYKSTIAPFGEYTLEAIIIYVIGLLYNCLQETSVVRVSTFIEKLKSTVIAQSYILQKKDSRAVQSTIPKDAKKKRKIDSNYLIGAELISFMIERQLIFLEHMSSDKTVVVKEKGQGYKQSKLFAVCNLDLSLIPLKLNLPMVCEPLDWRHVSARKNINDLDESKPLMLSDMVGGYLSSPSFDIYNCIFDTQTSLTLDKRFSLLSSRNLTNFNIELTKYGYVELCQVLTLLQKQGFKINTTLLEFITSNRASLEKEGFLMPSILTRLNLKEAYDFLRLSFHKNESINKTSKIVDLIKDFSIMVQTARYEDLIINLATAYDGYTFYLPAFMDFRGRIYRSGILHFHERDLARSLIVFANKPLEDSLQLDKAKDIIATSAAFKYQKFYNYKDAFLWFEEKQRNVKASNESLISFSKRASDQFQFMAKVLSYDRYEEYSMIPITQDAAASAYQIMSYFLLNEGMARRTNLIASSDGQIQDVYTHLLREFKEFLLMNFDDTGKMDIIESKLDRKLLKSLFMPLIYGKTIMSIEQNISEKYGALLSRKDCFQIAKLCTNYWKQKYPDIVNFMKLITTITWFCSAQDRAVTYSIPYFTTKQDYMTFNKEEILVYERLTRKRRRVTIQ